MKTMDKYFDTKDATKKKNLLEKLNVSFLKSEIKHDVLEILLSQCSSREENFLFSIMK